jgi:hypothetical protein
MLLINSTIFNLFILERVNQGSFASEFIELFKSYGIELEETELNSVKKIVNSQQKLIRYA